MSLKRVFFRTAFTLFFLLVTHPVFSETASIHTIKSMQEIKKYIDKDTLILLDLDHTVLKEKIMVMGTPIGFTIALKKGKLLELMRSKLLRKYSLIGYILKKTPKLSR